jgi:rhodanese-related sulfurtransferase
MRPLDKKNSIFEKYNQLVKRLEYLENRVKFLEQSAHKKNFLLKSFLCRMKNGEELSNDFIVNEMSYLDLSPEKAYRIYQDPNRDFVFLDVSKQVFQPSLEIAEAKKIPLEDLEFSTHLLPGKKTFIFVISEDGVRSILACKKLSKLGYYNLNNISGGYRYWPGKNSSQQSESTLKLA